MSNSTKQARYSRHWASQHSRSQPGNSQPHSVLRLYAPCLSLPPLSATMGQDSRKSGTYLPSNHKALLSFKCQVRWKLRPVVVSRPMSFLCGPESYFIKACFPLRSLHVGLRHNRLVQDPLSPRNRGTWHPREEWKISTSSSVTKHWQTRKPQDMASTILFVMDRLRIGTIWSGTGSRRSLST